MIQLIAIVYKDQQIATLHKLFWLECSQTDSSEDNESNTSPHDEDSGCSPLTSAEPSSDSSDTANYSKKAPQNDTRKVGASLYGEQHGHSLKNEPSTQLSLQQHQRNKTLVKQLHERAHTNMIVKNSEDDSRKHKTITSTSDIGGNNSGNSTCTVSDSGYTTQEAHESISSNDDECQNPNFNKAAGITQRLNKTVKQKAASGALMKRRSTPFCSTITDKYETKKRKLALKQRSHNVTHNKAWKLRMRGLKHKPTDDDIR